jgi:hypothetical protein
MALCPFRWANVVARGRLFLSGVRLPANFDPPTLGGMQPAIRRCIDQQSMARESLIACNQSKVMTLDADDFISRLVPHELPKTVP